MADKPKQDKSPKNRRQSRDGNNHDRPKRSLKASHSANGGRQMVQRVSDRHNVCIDRHTMNLVLHFLWHWTHLYTSTVQGAAGFVPKREASFGDRKSVV